ncbi:Phage tail protein [Amycolatopsis pretoriensis]|uniref:Phage tail protein n=1 Tax=Amycolatopsis pretoriensis TaxID=218821 RepID=A0A1H5R7P8_9PSEU|nr:phage tail domain-containing protein [Amycolatopsis pretoriensis]SEF34412.1 Phage tail protein [Amycolatopsis pretoriensis]
MTAEITTWIDASGSATVLDVDLDASGRFMPEPAFISNAVPGAPGERLRSARHSVHDFTIRVVISGANEPAVRASLRALMTAMDPTRGDGIIRVQSPLGDTREIVCRYVGGLGLDEKVGNTGPQVQFADVKFRAFDPFWRDPSDVVTAPYVVGVTPTFFPFFPIRLTASEIAVDTSITNGGDTEAWPVWQITGPGSSIVLRNLTTGKLLQFTSLVLGASEFVTIDTRPEAVTQVVKSDGTQIFYDLTATSSLWSLAVGLNAIRLEMATAAAGSSSLVLSYRQKYVSP